MKKISMTLMVTAFVFCVGSAFAKTEKCKVTAADVKGEKTVVTIECNNDTELKAGDSVKVKVQKKKVVEGC